MQRLMIEEAISIFGATELSKILKVSRKTIYNWLEDDSYGIEWWKGDFNENLFFNHLIVVKQVASGGVQDSREKRQGYVYCVSNGSVMKIGRTKKPNQRIKEIKSSYVPNATRVYVSDPMSDCCELELQTLNNFSSINISGELFEDNFDSAVKFIKENNKGIKGGAREKNVDPEYVFDKMAEKLS